MEEGNQQPTLEQPPTFTPPVEAVQPAAAPVGVATAQPVSQLNGPMPDELRGWNWGAFLLNWVWAIGHQVWIGLIALIPGAALIMAIVLGIKGNEWAWQHRKFESVEQFKAVQKKWTIWGAVLAILGLVVGIAMPIFVIYELSSAASHSSSSQSYQRDTSRDAEYGYPRNTQNEFRIGDLEDIQRTIDSLYMGRNKVADLPSTGDKVVNLDTPGNPLMAEPHMYPELKDTPLGHYGNELRENAIVYTDDPTIHYTYQSDGKEYTLTCPLSDDDGKIVKIYQLKSDETVEILDPVTTNES